MRLDTRKGRRDLRYRYVISYRDNGSFCLLFRSFFDCRSTWIHKATATSVLPSKQNHHEIYIDCDGGQRRRYCVAWRGLLLSRRNARRINHDSTRKRKHRVAIRCSSPTKENRPRAAAGEKTSRKWRVSRRIVRSSRFSTQSNRSRFDDTALPFFCGYRVFAVAFFLLVFFTHSICHCLLPLVRMFDFSRYFMILVHVDRIDIFWVLLRNHFLMKF